jgi:hypothetical protein
VANNAKNVGRAGNSVFELQCRNLFTLRYLHKFAFILYTTAFKLLNVETPLKNKKSFAAVREKPGAR